jgi:23S rRNA (guanosine2251-2'-O)-methyltransferase
LELIQPYAKLKESGSFLKTNQMIIGYYRECTNIDCGFRYPDINSKNEIGFCPKCGEKTIISSHVISSQKTQITSDDPQEIVPFLDNIRSVYNVGSIIRTCEGFGIREIILSGITPTPDHPRMDKTGLGSTPGIKWQYANNGFQKVVSLKETGFQIISLENTSTAIPINQVSQEMLQARICLVVGNENLGIDPDIQRISDLVVAIPMSGIKESFNVSVAFGIAAYHLAIIAKT